MSQHTSEHWSEYWSQGRLTSLPEDFAANYDGEVAEFWNAVFSEVPDHGNVLDLCSGNGAIALLAVDYFKSENRVVEITAVDAAEMNPEAVGQHFPNQSALARSIQFIPNCRVEDLQLPDHSIDLVTSQYGIEYCDWKQAAGQVVRVLKPGGRFVMVCHTPTSDMLRYMEQEQSEYEQLDERGFFAAVDDYLDGNSGAEKLQKQFETITTKLQEEFTRTGSALYRSVLGLMHNARQLPTEQLDNHREALRAYHAQMKSGRERLRDMLRVNQALNQDPQWTSVFTRAGLQANGEGQIRYRGQHNAGQYYMFRKPQGQADQKQDG